VRDAPRLPAPLGAGLKTYRKFSTAEFNDKARWSRRLTGLDELEVSTTVEEVRDKAPVRELPSSPSAVEQDPLLGYAARIADEYRENHGQPIPVPVLCKRLGVAEPVAARLRAQLVHN